MADVKGRSYSKPRDDGSVDHTLNGGPLNGQTIRMYPHRIPNPNHKKGVGGAPYTREWRELRYSGETYELPKQLDDKKPFLQWKDR